MMQAINVHDDAGHEFWLEAKRFFCVAVITTLVALTAYHPYYFGDELFSFTVAAGDRGWSEVFTALNSYKPRLFYNALWSSIAVSGAPRWVAMMLVVGASAASSVLIHRIATTRFGVSNLLGWVIALVVLTSRFSTIVYYDYISGSIETLSLALYLSILAMAFTQMSSCNAPSRERLVAMIVMALVLVNVHERYLAGLCVISAFLVLDAWRSRSRDTVMYCLAVMLTLLPLGFFVMEARALSDLPVATGTAAEALTLGADTFKAWAIYLSNVILGTNLGHPWLVGDLQWANSSNRPVLVLITALLVAAWVVPFCNPGWRNSANKSAAGLLIVSLIAFAAVASLPGTERLEGRWMIPAFACAALLACAFMRGFAAWFFTGALLVCNVGYFVTGSWQSIYNVQASHAMAQLASALNTILPGTRGVVLNVAEQDYNWPLSGVAFAGSDATSGSVFCTLNTHGTACVDPPSPSNLVDHSKYDFGLFSLGPKQGQQVYQVLSQTGLRTLLSPQSIKTSDLNIVGGTGVWSREWRWDSTPVFTAGGVEIHPGQTGTKDLPSTMLAGRFIVYRAQAVGGASTVPMRLQVNWGDTNGDFIDTQINVVQVDGTMRNYVTLLSPPSGAVHGQVYAVLHEGASSPVLLESIGLLQQ